MRPLILIVAGQTSARINVLERWAGNSVAACSGAEEVQRRHRRWKTDAVIEVQQPSVCQSSLVRGLADEVDALLLAPGDHAADRVGV